MVRAFKLIGGLFALFLMTDIASAEGFWQASGYSGPYGPKMSSAEALCTSIVQPICDAAPNPPTTDCQQRLITQTPTVEQCQIGTSQYGGPLSWAIQAYLQYSDCPVSTPYFNPETETCQVDPFVQDNCSALDAGGSTFVKVGTYDRATGTYTQDADFNGPGTNVDILGCTFQVGPRSASKDCGVKAGSNELVCEYTVTNTYTNFEGPGDGPSVSDLNENVSHDTTIQDWMDSTTSITTTPILNDTPGPGETQQTETEVTSINYPPEFHQETTSETTTITMKEGYDIIQTTTTTVTTHVDNSTTEVVNQNFDQSSQTTTVTVINNTPTAPGVTSSTAPGYTGGTTTTTVTDASGNITSTTTHSGTSPDGIPDTPNEEDEGEYTGPGDLNTEATDQALLDLQGVADGIGTDATSLENHSLFNLNPLDNLGGTCQSISFSMPNGETMVVPGADGCSKLSTLKSILEWVVYVMLIFYAYSLATRRTA